MVNLSNGITYIGLGNILLQTSRFGIGPYMHGIHPKPMVYWGEPHTSASALKCLSACPWPHTLNVFFQCCVFSKFGFQIQVARDSSNAEWLSRHRNKLASGSASVARLRQRLGKLDRNNIASI